MDQIFSEHWTILHYGVVLGLTCAQMLVIYFLSDSSSPPRGLGLFSVYFMAALLGWLAYTLQQGYSLELGVDVPMAASIINSYILFLAMSQRSGIAIGRVVLGLVCFGATLAVFFAEPAELFTIHCGAVALFSLATAILALRRSWRERNIGDAILAIATGILVVALPSAAVQAAQPDGLAMGQALLFGFYSLSYTLLVVGFLGSVAIEYQQGLSTMSTEDALTGLLNQRGMEDALQVSLASAGREGLATAAIMVDIDHFKRVNESFGHDTGDQVLCEIASLLASMCRSSDVVARVGGEEFLLVLPNTNMGAARILAERIRQAIADEPMIVDGQAIPITISLGVAGSNGHANLDVLSSEADQAMYIAKRGGRNRVASVERRPLHMSNTAD
ncbi:MAG: GGDEF domain-containing protein [Pseudomonadota bacterium]